MSVICEYTVGLENVGTRLDLFLSKSAQKLSRSQIKNLISKKHVWIDGIIALKAGQVLKRGQKIKIEIPAPKKLNLLPIDLSLKLLFEDQNIAVIEKPAGFSVHPSPTDTAPTIVHGLLHAMKSLSQIGGVERPGIVHRLDKGTSGIIVISKNDHAHFHLSQQFKEHTIERRYQALCFGNPKSQSGRIETFFGRSPINRKKMTGKLLRGKKAVTHWKLLKSLGPLSLIECSLETGRTHQIRVHLSELGFSIVGDPLYGDNKGKAAALKSKYPGLAYACTKLNHQMLHAYYLKFRHPITNQWLEFKSNLPVEFSDITAQVQK